MSQSNSDMIDDLTAIIASLTSRNEELEENVRKLRDANVVRATVEPVTDEKMYVNIISSFQDKLKSAQEKVSVLEQELATCNNSKSELNNMKDQLTKLKLIHIGDREALSAKIEALSKELDIACTLKYCRECGENTRHESEVCVQCAVKTYRGNNCDNTACDNTACDNESSGECNNTTTDNMHACAHCDIKIIGYQQVILALTDKLAEAYGMKK